MPSDIATRIGAVTRRVADREVEGRPARVVVAERAYDTSVDDLWDAITNAERIPRWFLPISGELKLGGRYQLEGNAGGAITACEPPRKLSVTWEFGGGVSWVNVTLSPEGEGARLELEHVTHVEDHWKRFGPGAVGIGWDLTLVGLEAHLAGAPFGEAEFSAGEDGKRFIRDSGEGWRIADIASGEDLAAAGERAARTVAFYTGEEDPGR
ncbi:MAG: SRPBCC family protein [Caulobacteraceae bacterium]|nr:SRPBCC family protein [Caulobacteraceae bacterium]